MNVETMLSYLTEVSNKYLPLNLGCHLLIYVSIALYFLFMKGNHHKIAKLIRNISVIILMVTVTFIAIQNGNPFHTITFVITIILTVIFQFVMPKKKLDSEKKSPNKTVKNVIMLSTAVILFIGIFYPEFTNVSLPKFLLYAPVGIVPCPTLLTVLGFTNLTANIRDKYVLITLACMASVYGIIGVFVFHIYFDITLLVLVAITIINVFFVEKYDIR